MLHDDERVSYNTYVKKADDLEVQNEDLKHTLSLFKDELNELIKVYIDPWIK